MKVYFLYFVHGKSNETISQTINIVRLNLKNHTHHSMNVIVGRLKNRHLGLIIELKSMTNTSDNTVKLLSQNALWKMPLLSGVALSINSKWAIFGLCHYCM